MVRTEMTGIKIEVEGIEAVLDWNLQWYCADKTVKELLNVTTSMIEYSPDKGDRFIYTAEFCVRELPGSKIISLPEPEAEPGMIY